MSYKLSIDDHRMLPPIIHSGTENTHLRASTD